MRRLAWPFGLLAGALLLLPHATSVLAVLFPATRPPLYPYADLARLAARQALLVALAVGAATLLAIPLAIATTRGPGRAFRPLVASAATAGQVFPPVAVLALAVPALGYGRAPALLALFLYGVLPVLSNALAGFDGVPADTREAADAMGLTPAQRLARVELPLAAPAIVAGIRTAAIVDLGTASIASTVGVPTLGAPILDGLVAEKTGYVFEGALVAVLLAIAVDAVFGALAARAEPAQGGGTGRDIVPLGS